MKRYFCYATVDGRALVWKKYLVILAVLQPFFYLTKLL